MTIISDTWLKVARFRAQLRKDGNAHNFADADPEFAFDASGVNILVTRANNTATTYDGGGSTSVPLNITIPGIGVPVNDRQLAGYWFTGDGDWNAIARWNNVTSENSNQLPAAGSNVGVFGKATVTDARSVNELSTYGRMLTLETSAQLTANTLFIPEDAVLTKWNFENEDKQVEDFEDPDLDIGYTADDGLGKDTDAFYIIGNANLGFEDIDGNYAAAFRGRNTAVGNLFVARTTSEGFTDNELSFSIWRNFTQAATIKLYASTTPSSDWGDYEDPVWIELQTISVNEEKTSYTFSLGTEFSDAEELYLQWALTASSGAANANRIYLDDIALTGDLAAPGILIQSTPAGTGSLIHNNTGVAATIERYIAAADWNVDGDGWHLLSSPAASQTIEGDWTPSGAGNDFDFYGFSEPEQEWINFKNTTVPPTWAVFNGPDFAPGRGYLVAYEQAGTKTFTGAINVENVANISITRSGTPDNDNHYGWNLVGNPFASALTWTGSVAGNNLGGVAKVWNETTMAYVDITAGSAIPSANGFFVSATDATGIVSLHSFNRVHSSQNWYKSNDERILLVAGDQQVNSAQQSVIRFNEEATPGYDAMFDAYFMAGYAPMFYSVADEKRFSTNTLPEMSSGMSIPLGFHKNSHSDFFIEMQESIEDIIIYLTDLKEDVTQNLSEEPVYYFSASADDNPDRFVLSFATVSVPEVLKKGLLQAYTYGDMLYVLNPSEKATVELYGVQGQLIMSRDVGQGVNSIPLAVPNGTYIVKMFNANEAATRKVVIN
jgi:hypothetical protein